MRVFKDSLLTLFFFLVCAGVNSMQDKLGSREPAASIVNLRYSLSGRFPLEDYYVHAEVIQTQPFLLARKKIFADDPLSEIHNADYEDDPMMCLTRISIKKRLIRIIEKPCDVKNEKGDRAAQLFRGVDIENWRERMWIIPADQNISETDKPLCLTRHKDKQLSVQSCIQNDDAANVSQLWATSYDPKYLNDVWVCPGCHRYSIAWKLADNKTHRVDYFHILVAMKNPKPDEGVKHYGAYRWGSPPDIAPPNSYRDPAFRDK